ncbi:G-I-Y Y-I-G endonuclease [Gordonia phage Sixama]|uniref:G-I-Y Y-I-G endonuclease n=1 Tax=Gordonia phage Sixama TaxID=2653271 RepID=A0A5Q2F244_9CAUD|nr:G-I-Y Y-I-G endonuclease [Gordonia phage Sixama]QGF20331.1 G-I-Y Y-I-G endonuclease [Gordonia phage Sixama]
MGVIYALHTGDYDFRYVGQTKHTSKYRLRRHKEAAVAGTYPVHSWMRKHGISSIKIATLEEVDSEFLNFAEVKWISILRAEGKRLLNCDDGGGTATITDEHRKKLSEAQLKRYAERPKPPVSEETRAKLREAAKKQHARRKYTHSQETKDKIAESKRGKKRPQHVIDALVASHKGKTRSEEYRKKIGDTSRGRKHTEETKRKMSEARKEYWKNRRKENDDYSA